MPITLVLDKTETEDHGSLQIANLAPGSVRDPVSRNKMEIDRTAHPTLSSGFHVYAWNAHLDTCVCIHHT